MAAAVLTKKDVDTITCAIDAIIYARDDRTLKYSLEAFIHIGCDTYKLVLSDYDVVPSVWTKLFDCLNERNPEIQFLCLEALRILTRDTSNFEFVLTPERIHTLLVYANIEGDTYRDTDFRTSAALTCLYNIICFDRQATKLLIEHNYIDLIVGAVLFSESSLISQLRMFDTKIENYVAALFRDISTEIRQKHGLKHLVKKLEYVQSLMKSRLSTVEAHVFSEILKIVLTLNITRDEEDRASCLNLVRLLRRLLEFTVLNDQTKKEFYGHIIAILTKMPFSSYMELVTPLTNDELFPRMYRYKEYNIKAVFRLVEYLKTGFSNIGADHREWTQILTVLARAAKSVRIVRKYLCLKFFPNIPDEYKPPEDMYSIRNQLCRLMTSPVAETSYLTTNLLFVLCKENVKRMMKLTGYNNVKDILCEMGLLKSGPLSNEYSSESDDAENEEYKHYIDNIDVTASMTEDQKQLFNILDYISRTTFTPVEPAKLEPTSIEQLIKLQDSIVFPKKPKPFVIDLT